MSPVKIKGEVPKFQQDLIPYMDEAGWKYTHRDILGRYVFLSKQERSDGMNTIAFTLHELREAYHYGF